MLTSVKHTYYMSAEFTICQQPKPYGVKIILILITKAYGKARAWSPHIYYYAIHSAVFAQLKTLNFSSINKLIDTHINQIGLCALPPTHMSYTLMMVASALIAI